MQRALGWLSWPPSEVMGTDVNLIRIALAGRIDLLQAIFGTEKPTATQRRGATPAEWNAFKTRHNVAHSRRHPTRVVRTPKPQKGGADG